MQKTTDSTQLPYPAWHRSPRLFIPVCALILIYLLSGCNTTTKPFHIKSIAKTDIDMVADQHLQEITSLTRELAIKLYKRNPGELLKSPTLGSTLETRLDRIIDCKADKNFAEIQNLQSVDAMLLSFDETFEGDRVFALVCGLYTMLLNAYSNDCEFFMISELDQQKLYNSARNIEILVWRLKTRTTPDGDLCFLTNETDDPIKNLSFERLFGKMIALQDMMAVIVSEQTHRVIKKAVQFAGMSFLPI